MRATISFETDVSRVSDIMRSLVLEESNALQDALIALEKATADRTVEGISEALEHIHGVANQLEQYRQMMVSFEKARFETLLPQSASGAMEVSSMAQAHSVVEKMQQFDNFLDKINRGDEDGDASEEG